MDGCRIENGIEMAGFPVGEWRVLTIKIPKNQETYFFGYLQPYIKY